MFERVASRPASIDAHGSGVIGKITSACACSNHGDTSSIVRMLACITCVHLEDYSEINVRACLYKAAIL